MLHFTKLRHILLLTTQLVPPTPPLQKKKKSSQQRVVSTAPALRHRSSLVNSLRVFFPGSAFLLVEACTQRTL